MLILFFKLTVGRDGFNVASERLVSFLPLNFDCDADSGVNTKKVAKYNNEK